MRALRRVVTVGCLCLLASGVRSDENLTIGQHEFDGSAGLVWESYSAGEGFRAETGNRVALGPDQRTVFVLGTHTILLDGFRPFTKVLVRAYDARSGEPKWTVIYPEAPETYGNLGAFAVSPDGESVYVVGQDPNAPSPRAFVLALDAATGAQRWLVLLNPLGFSADAGATSVQVSRSGDRVFVGGFSETRGVVWAFDAVTGALHWETIYRPSTGIVLWVNSLELGPDNSRLVAVGSIPVLVGNTLWNDSFVSAFDTTTGQRVWDVRDAGRTEKTASSPDGVLLVRVIDRVPGDSDEAVLAATNVATGLAVWERLIGPAFTSGGDLRLSANGDRCLATISRADGGHVTALRSTDGSTMWDSGSLAPVFPFALALSPRGDRVIVAGHSSQETPTVYAAAGLDADTGAQVWTASTAGPGATPNSRSGIAGVAVRSRSRGNEVFVTGTMRRFLPSGMFEDFIGTLDYCEPSFADVPCAFFAWAFVEALAEAGVVTGFPDGLFRPGVIVRRDQAAVFLARALDLQAGDLSSFVPPACDSESFTDISCTDGAYRFVEYVAVKGIATGFPDGTFRPAQTLTRGEMAAFLARVRDAADGDLSAFTPPKCGGESFRDVPCVNPFYRFVEYARQKGIVAGFPDGTYHPATAVTRGQMAVFLVRAAQIEL